MISEQEVFEFKKYFLDTAYKYQISHIPSCLSCFEILYVLYKNFANITKENASDINRNRVILSKEHARLSQLCILHKLGLLDEKCVTEFKVNGGISGQDIYNLVSNELMAAVDYASGSLGHGAGVALGLAYNSNNHIYTIIGDGELQEGSVWEAIMFAGHHKMSNYTLILDRNLVQIDDYTKNIIYSSDNIKQRLESFDFEVIECDGHNIFELENALNIESEKPKFIIANTIKGKEILFKRDELGHARYHWCVISDKDMEKIKKEFYHEY